VARLRAAENRPKSPHARARRCRWRRCEVAGDPRGLEDTGGPGRSAVAPSLRTCGREPGDRAARIPLLPRLRAGAGRLLHSPLHARGWTRRLRDPRRRHRHRERGRRARSLQHERGGRTRAQLWSRQRVGDRADTRECDGLVARAEPQPARERPLGVRGLRRRAGRVEAAGARHLPAVRRARSDGGVAPSSPPTSPPSAPRPARRPRPVP
jgi:hypothetical protein